MLLKKIVSCVELLKSKKYTIALAEGISNGSVFDAFASFKPADYCLTGGMIASNNRMKEYFFGIPEDKLNYLGSESPEVAEIMAHKLPKYFNADIYIAITGGAEFDSESPVSKTSSEQPINLHLYYPKQSISKEILLSDNEVFNMKEAIIAICDSVINKIRPENSRELEMAY